MSKPMEGQMQMVVPHPRHTGEVVDLHTADTDLLLDVHDGYADLIRELGEDKRSVDDELIRRLDFEGRRSITLGRFKVSVDPPTAREWDVDRLQATLDDLVEHAVISAIKADKCLRLKVEPVAKELKTLESDPRTGDLIRACFTERSARRYLKVTRRG